MARYIIDWIQLKDASKQVISYLTLLPLPLHPWHSFGHRLTQKEHGPSCDRFVAFARGILLPVLVLTEHERASAAQAADPRQGMGMGTMRSQQKQSWQNLVWSSDVSSEVYGYIVTLGPRQGLRKKKNLNQESWTDTITVGSTSLFAARHISNGF